MTASEWGLLITLSVLWGGSFFFIAVAVREIPPLTLVVGRVALAAVTLWIVLLALGERLPRDRRVWLAFGAMGFLNNVIPFTLIVWAQQSLPSGVASILNATTPLFTVLIAHALTATEKLTPLRLAGVGLGLAGVAIMIGGLVGSGGHGAVAAYAAVLCAAISYGFAGLYGRRFRALGVTPTMTAAGQVTASSLMLIPVMLIVDQPWTLPVPGPSALAALVALGVVSTALAYVLFFRILATAGATNLSLTTFLIPVSAITLGILVLGEALYPRHVVGFALIVLGLAAIDGRPWTALRKALGRRPLKT